ncbi:MAG: translation initiation factor IF-6 [Nanoarchaeota archaeon]|nr:translation initiation factor IF-6 [Nanoarchaeota archaeon]MBU4301045.1 translation initiation factor IF-6 [Nanoarchaeota archaeon]MBU4452285.1 translation initiation factor IF-6 [Nanoarchaeota archaeon]MCG2724037.1 translation initiation factor IF-6 [archaeon]
MNKTKKTEDNDHMRFADFQGDPNIGLFGIVTEKYTVLPEAGIDVSFLVKTVAYTTIAGTKLCGLFLAGNSHGLIVPETITEREMHALKNALKGVNILKLKSKYTAIGNLILCNDKGAVISPLLRASAEEIAECLNVKVSIGNMLDLDIIGAMGVATKKGFLLDMYVGEVEFKFVKDALGVDGDIGTVNFGSEFVKSGILANSKGILIGNATTGPETARIDEALGFI